MKILYNKKGFYLIDVLDISENGDDNIVIDEGGFRKVVFKHLIYTDNLYKWISYESYKVMKSDKSSLIVLYIKNK